MLSGLSRKSGLRLLSPALNPVQTTSTTSTYPRGALAISNKPSALDSTNEEGRDTVLSTHGPPSAPNQEPAHLSYEESSTADIMDTSISDGDRINKVSGSDCKPLTDNEVSGGAISSTIMAAEHSSLGIGNNDASMFNITSVSLLSAINPFEEVSIPSQEEEGRMDVTDNENGVDEGPDRGMSYERSSLIFGPSSSTTPLQNHVRLQESEESATKLVEDGNVLSELPGHQVTFQEEPSSTINPYSSVNSARNDAGLLELDECSENLVSDENGISFLADHVPFQEKSSSTTNPCSAVSSMRSDAGLLKIEKCISNLVHNENGINALAGHVPLREMSSSVINPIQEEARLLPNDTDRLVDEIDRLCEEQNCLASQEKPSSVISPVEEIAILQEVQGSPRSLVDDEDQHCEPENDDLWDEKPCSPISTGAVLSAEQGSTTNLGNEADGFEKAGHEMYHENPSLAPSAIVTSASTSLVEGSVMQLASDEDKPDEEQFSTYGTVETDATDAPLPRKRKKKIKKKTTATKSDVKVDTPFQTWLQNFATFCKKLNVVKQKQTETNENSFEDSDSQGARTDYRGKKCCKKKKRKDSILGNLESCNTSADIQVGMETDCVPSTTVNTSMSESICEDSTGHHMGSSDYGQIELKSDSLNSAESVRNRLNVFEVMERKKQGIDNAKDDQSVSENALGTGENCGMEIDSEDTYAGKKSLLIDNSSDEEQPSEKKLKKESDSECKERIERPLDSNWDKSDDLPLMANVDEVLVYHYILDLSVEFNEKIMKGNIVLFLEPRNDVVTKKQFQMTLDSSLVNIESVSEVSLPDDYKVTFCGRKQNSPLTQETTPSGVQNGFLGNILGDKTHTPLPFKGLPYSVYGWCVQIWKPDATGKAWPRCVWIKYHTSPEGTSLTWATDQDGK